MLALRYAAALLPNTAPTMTPMITTTPMTHPIMIHCTCFGVVVGVAGDGGNNGNGYGYEDGAGVGVDAGYGAGDGDEWGAEGGVTTGQV